MSDAVACLHDVAHVVVGQQVAGGARDALEQNVQDLRQDDVVVIRIRRLEPAQRDGIRYAARSGKRYVVGSQDGGKGGDTRGGWAEGRGRERGGVLSARRSEAFRPRATIPRYTRPPSRLLPRACVFCRSRAPLKSEVRLRSVASGEKSMKQKLRGGCCVGWSRVAAWVGV